MPHSKRYRNIIGQNGTVCKIHPEYELKIKISEWMIISVKNGL